MLQGKYINKEKGDEFFCFVKKEITRDKEMCELFKKEGFLNQGYDWYGTSDD